MAWDFSTEPEFQEQLDWMRDVRARGDLADRDDRSTSSARSGFERVDRAAAGAGQGARAVGRAPAARARRPGLRPGQARPDARDPRHARRSRRTRSATRRPTPATARSSRWPGTDEQKERWLYPLLAGDLQLGVLDDRAGERRARTRRCCRRRAVRDGDEWVINGHKWFTSNASIADFLIVMAVTDPDARPHQRASMFIVPADTPGVNIVRDVPTMEHPYEHFGTLGGHAEILYEDVRVPAGRAARRRGRRLPDRPAAARPGPHPPLHALARRLAARLRHALRARALRARPTARCWPRSRRSRTGSPTRRRRCRRRG